MLEQNGRKAKGPIVKSGRTLYSNFAMVLRTSPRNL
jgi:hypothetical protein